MAVESVIVSRHPADVEFIRQEAGLSEDVPVMDDASITDVVDKIVYGNVPLHLAAAARAVVAVEFDGEPPRAREYTADEMRAAGARLRPYFVDCLHDGRRPDPEHVESQVWDLWDAAIHP